MATFMSSTLPNQFSQDLPYPVEKKPLKCYPNNPLLRRPKSFLPEQNYGGLMFKQEPFYGYAVIQRPYLVPLSNASVYMSCYGSVTNEPHYYVNGNFLAEKLRYEEDEVWYFFDKFVHLFAAFLSSDLKLRRKNNLLGRWILMQL